MRRIRRAGKKMRPMIEELLLLASVRYTPVPRELVTIRTIVGAALERLTLLVTETSARIHLPESWPTVLGHGPWLKEAWASYLSSALQSSWTWSLGPPGCSFRSTTAQGDRGAGRPAPAGVADPGGDVRERSASGRRPRSDPPGWRRLLDPGSGSGRDGPRCSQPPWTNDGVCVGRSSRAICLGGRHDPPGRVSLPLGCTATGLGVGSCLGAGRPPAGRASARPKGGL
jgi:hypothetical protein